ncbi:hypothetical protein HDC90_000986 [Pedobacter sp. AK013]|nr:hypothetical protein [Pedobacter sp. AK013]
MFNSVLDRLFILIWPLKITILPLTRIGILVVNLLQPTKYNNAHMKKTKLLKTLE